MSTAAARSRAADAARTATFDEAKAQAFAGRMLKAMNEAALMLMSSIGHRTGLFESLARVSPCTVGELAAKSKLAERYVREWLAVMATSGVVTYDPAKQRYTLPAEHAAFLTDGGPANIAVDTQFVGVAAGVEDEIVARFRDGKGMHYHQYGRFHTVMADSSAQSIVARLIDTILPLVPGLVARLERGISVADVGCGGGRALLVLARAFPRSRFLGLDYCGDAFEEASTIAEKEQLANLSFQQADISRMDRIGRHDLVLAFDAVHDQKDPQGMLDTIRRSLREDGVLLMADIGGSSRLENNIDHPLGAWLYTISCLHCAPVSMGQGGPGLGAMWGVELAQEMLARAGFRDVRVMRLDHDVVNAYFVARP